ncbi:hypothetical protein ABT127_12335 [Streptomyces sp. NPDC001904]|uniref:hypothetical protein n=1 Tax=Streptomyces sp. NPDC001904 TaxID=3154531 RepID=UPI00332A36B4
MQYMTVHGIGGSTGIEQVIGFLLAITVPIVVGGALIFSLVGLTMWATAPIRRRRRARSGD